MPLLEQLRAARERWISVGAFEFLVRRPTLLQFTELREQSTTEMVRACVMDWRNLPEHELVPGGGGQVPAFESAVFIEWAQDRPDVWQAVCSEINRAVAEHIKQRETAKKK